MGTSAEPLVVTGLTCAERKLHEGRRLAVLSTSPVPDAQQALRKR